MNRLVFETMGTVASLATVGAALDEARADAVRAVFHTSDERFSLFRTDSQLSRIARGDLGLPDADPAVRDCYAEAMGWDAATAGAFRPHRPADGVLDLSGIVKAAAMRDAAVLLDGPGVDAWCLAVGGDVLVSADSDQDWTVGIVDPDDRAQLLTAIALSPSRVAVATSGSAERGDHIWTPPGTRSEFAQVSVAAADIVTADVLATAIVSAGASFLDEATARWDIDVLTIDRAGEVRATPGMRAMIRDAAA